MAQTSIRYPTGALVRVRDIVGDPRNGTKGLLPITAGTWWLWVKQGKVPPGRKLATRTTVWALEDVLGVGGHSK